MNKMVMELSKNDIKKINSLAQKKFRDELGLFVVEGEKLLLEALDFPELVEMVIYTPENEKSKVIKKASELIGKIYKISDGEFENVSNLDTPPGILAVIKKPKHILRENNDLVLLLDKVKDPGNLGTIIRTADWFGVKNIYLSQDTVDAFNPKTIQSTMGSIFHLNIHENVSLLETILSLRKDNFYVLGADMSGSKTSSLDNKKIALVMGSESHGLSADVSKACDAKITIPGKGRAESLNVAVACGILLNNLSSR